MSQSEHEPYEISARFYLAMEAKAIVLERDASSDASRATTLTDPGHVQRQYRLVKAQRAEAQRFRSFLADVRVRIK